MREESPELAMRCKVKVEAEVWSSCHTLHPRATARGLEAHLQQVERVLRNDAGQQTDDTLGQTREAFERLVADSELLLELALSGYRGASWERFRTVLAKYGFAVIRAWCLNGKIFENCAAAGYGRPPPPPREIETDDAEELAGETVARSLNYFREQVLIKSRWDARKGASLRTFFVGSCIRCFSNVYGSWRKENQIISTLPEDPEIFPAHETSPEARVVLGETLACIPPAAHDLFSLVASGHSQKEIAEAHGLTPKAVERRIARIREDLRSEHVRQV